MGRNLVRRGDDGNDVVPSPPAAKLLDRADEVLVARVGALASPVGGRALFRLFGVFVSPSLATWLGATYVVLRSVYPLLLGRRLSKVQSRRVALVTFPCYALVYTMLGGAAWAVVTGQRGG